MKKSPHDRFFSYAFSFEQVYRDFFEQMLPKWFIDLLDLKTLQPDGDKFHSPKLRSFFADKLFSCQLKAGGKVLLACLLEHKSYVPADIHDQLQRYVAEKYTADQKKKPKVRSLVVPIVIYHGEKKWKKKRPYERFPGLPKKLRPYAQAPDYILIDLSRFSKKRIKELREGYLVNSLLLLKYAFSPGHLERNYRDIFFFGNFYETVEEGQLFLKGLFEYFLKLGNFGQAKTEAIVEDIIEQIPSTLKPSVMTIAETLIEKGKREGEIKGQIKGEIKGQIKGQKEGRWEEKVNNTKSLLLKFPHLEDETIAELLNCPLQKVKELREECFGDKKKP